MLTSLLYLRQQQQISKSFLLLSHYLFSLELIHQHHVYVNLLMQMSLLQVCIASPWQTLWSVLGFQLTLQPITSSRFEAASGSQTWRPSLSLHILTHFISFYTLDKIYVFMVSKYLSLSPGTFTPAFNPNTQEAKPGRSLWVQIWSNLLDFMSVRAKQWGLV